MLNKNKNDFKTEWERVRNRGGLTETKNSGW